MGTSFADAIPINFCTSRMDRLAPMSPLSSGLDRRVCSVSMPDGPAPASILPGRHRGRSVSSNDRTRSFIASIVLWLSAKADRMIRGRCAACRLDRRCCRTSRPVMPGIRHDAAIKDRGLLRCGGRLFLPLSNQLRLNGRHDSTAFIPRPLLLRDLFSMPTGRRTACLGADRVLVVICHLPIGYFASFYNLRSGSHGM